MANYGNVTQLMVLIKGQFIFAIFYQSSLLQKMTWYLRSVFTDN